MMIQRHFLSRDLLQFLDKSVSSYLSLVLMSLLSQLVQSRARLAVSFISEVQSFTRETLTDTEEENTRAVCVDILAALAQGESGKSEDKLGFNIFDNSQMFSSC